MKQALLTASITLLGAIVLFAISEFSRGLFIKPMLKIRELIGDIVDKVIYYSGDLTSGAKVTPEREKVIREELRALATQLRAKEHMLLAYGFWAWLRLVPRHSDIDTCARMLVSLSNSFQWERGRMPPQYFEARYEANIKSIIRLQKSLKLKSEIVPEIEP